MCSRFKNHLDKHATENREAVPMATHVIPSTPNATGV
uniref:Uncharacterized protein n=1 Tax=Anguilla anguilla TaxID=7936 RepID=A0A0E9TFS6_ANGAN